MSLLRMFHGDVDRVLKYAFRVSGRQIIAGSSLFRQMMSTGIKVQSSGEGRLTDHEDHAQAAVILHAVDQLPDKGQAIIYGFYDGKLRGLAVRVLSKHIDGQRGLPTTIKTILISEWLERDNRRNGRHLKREQNHLVDTGQLERAMTGTQLHYARKLIFGQLDVIDEQARAQLHLHWA